MLFANIVIYFITSVYIQTVDLQLKNSKMEIKTKIINFIYKYQKLVEGLVIFLIFLSVSFTFDRNGATLVWHNYPGIAFAIAIIAVLLGVILVRIERYKIQRTSSLLSKNKKDNTKYKLLTNRQKQVYDLILLNKSNKEICNELFIEISTLKTHINRIYKIMNVQNREELKKSEE